MKGNLSRRGVYASPFRLTRRTTAIAVHSSRDLCVWEMIETLIDCTVIEVATICNMPLWAFDLLKRL